MTAHDRLLVLMTLGAATLVAVGAVAVLCAVWIIADKLGAWRDRQWDRDFADAHDLPDPDEFDG